MTQERFVGITELKASFNSYIEDLTDVDGPASRIMVMRNNRPVAVILSYQEWQTMKTKAQLVVAALPEVMRLPEMKRPTMRFTSDDSPPVEVEGKS